MPDRPNVLFIVSDQFRGDCVSADPLCPTDDDGRPVVQTPNISDFADGGALFSRAYSPAPTCIPARRCLWTGQGTVSAKATVNNHLPWDFEHPLPEVLRDAGYQTHLAGKTHSQPARTHFGFEGLDLHSGLAGVEEAGLDDYHNWLTDVVEGDATESSVGMAKNVMHYARPWHLDEHYHPTHWTTDRAEEFVQLRDRTRPFFLTVSYHRPHPPYDPPQAHWDQYIDADLPDPAWGDWTDDVFDTPDEVSGRVHRCRTGYYGSVTHVDHQVRRVWRRLNKEDELANTLIVFAADHGEMLGDHGQWGKNCAYEGATRVPLLIQFPETWDRDPVGVVDRPVGLQDIMPTILDAAGVDIPDTVEGRSLLELCDDPERDDWRSAYHGEFSPESSVQKACQFLVDEERKYVWNPVTGREQLFDLGADPHEERDLAGDPAHAATLQQFRRRLVDRLADRSEGFVSDGELQTVDPDAWRGIAGE
jgi:arylsulfatase A-like enzyme